MTQESNEIIRYRYINSEIFDLHLTFATFPCQAGLGWVGLSWDGNSDNRAYSAQLAN